MEELIKLVEAWIERKEADGCKGCVFTDKEEWELPCSDCKRNHKDYWRPKEWEGER